MLLDLDVPEALDVLLLGVVVALMSWRITLDLGDTERKEGEREELERVLSRCAVRDFRKQGVLCSGFLVRGRLESANSSLDCTVSAGAVENYASNADL